MTEFIQGGTGQNHECERTIRNIELRSPVPEVGARIRCTCGQWYELRLLRFWAVFAKIHSSRRFFGDYYWGKVK